MNTNYRNGSRLFSGGAHRLELLALILIALTVSAPTTFADEESEEESYPLIVTSSPRDTIETFERLTREWEEVILAYRRSHSRANWERARLLAPSFFQLMDLSQVTSAKQDQVGFDTTIYLLEIIGRVGLPPLESIPGVDDTDSVLTKRSWRVPGTPITIERIGSGAREGEYLFSETTVEFAPLFYERIQRKPVISAHVVRNWREMITQLHGPLIPTRLVDALPDSMKNLWLDTPIWKIVLTLVVVALIVYLLIEFHRLVNAKPPERKILAHLRLLLTPVSIVLVTSILSSVMALELNITGAFANLFDVAATVVIVLANVWIFWLVMVLAFEWIILSPRISEQSLDANLLRLCARVIAFVGSVLILAVGAQQLGLPVLGLLAGLGVGGLAVALAIRPTLENLIGGVILFIDKPVRVGDFCSFGQQMGTVEYIGVRSTQVRALDRTLISIPNATFADMEIVNWAKCDTMLIQRTIGLRFETETDQLRYVLAKFREMLFAHPKIDPETVRVRFIGHGESSLNIQIRVYAQTREWNEFYAIQEDVFLRIDEIVRGSGTGFAFPSQTLYVGKDGGLDPQLSEEAVEEVTAWRRSNRLPFPRMSHERLHELADTLDYPPHGSPDAAHVNSESETTAEPLSAEPDTDSDGESDTDTDNKDDIERK